MQNLLRLSYEKILLLASVNLRDDYLIDAEDCQKQRALVNADIGEHHPWCVAGNNREVGVGNGVFIQKRQKE